MADDDAAERPFDGDGPAAQIVDGLRDDVIRCFRAGDLTGARRADRELQEWEGDDERDDHAPPRLRRGADLVTEIRARAHEPEVPIMLGDAALVALPLGELAAVLGQTGSGKSTLAIGAARTHARDRGPAIYLSREMPARLVAARAIGMHSDASWRSVLRGEIDDAIALAALPDRLTILDGDAATLDEVERAADLLADEYPGEPLLVVYDYAQIIAPTSGARDIRARVTDTIIEIAAWVQHAHAVAIVISQMPRHAARAVRSGELIGRDTTDTGAESAAIERAAHVTITIGEHEPADDDGVCSVGLSLGKLRMGRGDEVVPARYDGRSGRWQVVGDARPAAEVKAERRTARDDQRVTAAADSVHELLAGSTEPLYGPDVYGKLGGDRGVVYAAIRALVQRGRVVRVATRQRGGSFPLWTPDRATAAGLAIAPEASNA